MFKYRDNVVFLDYSNQQQTIITHQTASVKNTKPQTEKATKLPTQKIPVSLNDMQGLPQYTE